MTRKSYYRLPETDEEIDKVLSDNNVDIGYSDVFVRADGTKRNRPDLGMWSLSWSQGAIGMGYKENQEDRARLYASIFIVLWNHGMDVGDACMISSLRVKETFQEFEDLRKSSK